METERVAVSDARTNMSELLSSVHHRRRCVLLTQRGKDRAAVVPADLGEEIEAAGGPDAALAVLRAARES